MALSIEQLEAASAEQGAAVAALKKQKAEKPVVDAAVADLLQKKAALKEALESALAAAKASGDAAAVAVLDEKIAKATPRPPTHKQPKKDAAPKGGGGEKPAAAAPPATKAAPAKPAAAPAAKQPAASAAAPAAPPSLAALLNVAALDAHMESRSFVAGGPSPTQADVTLLRALTPPDGATHPNAARWHAHMLGLSAYKLANLPGAVTTLAPPAPSPAAPSSSLAAGATCAPCGPGGASAIAGGFAWSSEPVCRGQHPKWQPPPASQGQRVTGLRVHNSLTSEKELFVPKEGNKVSWYTCGPTVYDACHMGHARAYLTMDILRRLLEDYFGYEVFMQVNVTDVDDKIIKRARVNRLLADYVARREAEAATDSAAALSAVRKEASDAAAAFGAKMRAKLAKLEIPVADRREEDERQTLLEQQKQKLASWAVSEELIAKAVADPKATVSAVCAAAAEPLSEALDAELGAAVTDHAIFNAHSRRYEAEFIEDLAALNIRMPDALTRVTEYLEKVPGQGSYNPIVDFVAAIVEKGHAYESNGSVYMDVSKFRCGHDYPKLEPSKGKATQAEMEESEGALFSAEAGEKRNPADFALWKKSKGGEPSWPSPWGGGRPGWHIECSVMASDLMGAGMDVHAGGSDLKFPHHDNELAQSEAFHGCQQWVNYFFHFGHLHIKGLKMSKSLKNFITIRQALEAHTARQIRLMFLLQPWDKPMNYSDQTIEEARAREVTFKSYFAEVKDQLRKPWLARRTTWDQRSRDLFARLQAHQAAVHECLCDNFNTAGAMAALLAIVTDANSYVKDNAAVDALLLKKGATFVTRILRVFGVATQEDFGFPVGGEAGGGFEEQVGPVVSALVAFRDQVRKEAKGVPALMGACDELRDNALVDLGVRVEDRADGARWTLDEPAVLRAEQQAKQAMAAELKVQKVLNKAVDKAKDLARAEANLVPADQLLRRPPHADKYAADSFDADGKPSKLADGGALSKGQEKEVAKLLKKQAEAYAKQAALLEATPNLLDTMRSALASLQAELRAVLADAPTMAVLSPEMVAQIEAALA